MADNINTDCNAVCTVGGGGPKPYRLGVALSGGGARGFAHAGALQALEEAGLRPDVIAGVSAGAVAAVLYAAGIAPNKMLDRFTKKFTDYASVSLGDGAGLMRLSKMAKFVEKNTGVKNIEELRCPAYIGVTDIDNGTPAEFHSGPIGERVVASCSIPIVFHPVKIGGVHYVDGGVLRNLPAWTIRDKCDKLISINCSPLTNYKFRNSIFDVAIRTYNLMAKSNQEEDMRISDLVIKTPELARYQVFNLKDINKAYTSGYAAAHRAIKDWLAENPEFKDYSPSWQPLSPEELGSMV